MNDSEIKEKMDYILLLEEKIEKEKAEKQKLEAELKDIEDKSTNIF